MLDRRLAIAGSVGVLAAALGITILVQPSPRLVWNASASAPLGLYRLDPGRPPFVGDWAVVHTPEPAKTLAAMRHYLPANVPLVKRVAAGPGQRVCMVGDQLMIDGKPAAVRLRHDALGRPLPLWQACRQLRARELFLLGEARDSFDSRYFGPIDKAAVLGRAVPIWTW